MRLVSTTGPKEIFSLFSHFFQTQLLAYNLEKYLHLVLAPRFTTKQLTHGCEQQFLAYQTALQRLPSLNQIHVFSSFQMNNPNNRDNLPQIQHFLSPTKGIPEYSQYLKQFPPI